MTPDKADATLMYLAEFFGVPEHAPILSHLTTKMLLDGRSSQIPWRQMHLKILLPHKLNYSKKLMPTATMSASNALRIKLQRTAPLDSMKMR